MDIRQCIPGAILGLICLCAPPGWASGGEPRDQRYDEILIGPTEEDESPADDEIRLLQDVAPLTPQNRLRPAAPRTSTEGRETAGNILGQPAIAGMNANRGRGPQLARGRSTAPSMIGDFFGGVPASGSMAPGGSTGLAATSDARLVGGITLPSSTTFTATGAYFAPANGGSLNGPGAIPGSNGGLQAFGGLVPLDANGKPLPATPNQPLFAITTTGQSVTGLQEIPPTGQGGSIDVPFDPNSPIFDLRPELIVLLPNPGSSGAGLVGRSKLSENGSPMPRDRVFINYSYFENVPLRSNGVNVNRFTPGFEKTFFDGQTSLEFRFPFATTMSNHVGIDGATDPGATLFGDIAIAGKMLFYTSETMAISGGLQVGAPTASDLHVGLADGTELVRINNRSVYLMPFLGALYTPDDRFFTQGFLQIDTPANSNPVYVNNFGNGLDSAGSIRDVTFLYADVGAGYWFYRNDEADGLTGISSTLELHYNRSLQSTDALTTGLYQIGSVLNNIEALNFVIGGQLHFNQVSTLSLGYVAPLGNRADQMFDGELRISFNYRFGPQTPRTQTTF